MTSKSSAYTKALQSLGGISGSDFRSWKILCGDNIRKTTLEIISNPLELIEELEQKNIVGEDNVKSLIEMMKTLGRLSEAGILADYEKKWALTESNQQSDYDRLLLKINGALEDSELESIKFLCRNYSGFTKDKRGKMTSCRDVFTGLEQALLLDKNETSTLKDLMKQISRLDLCQHVDKYEQKYNSKSEPFSSGQQNIHDLSDEFDIIVRHIGKNWRQYARRLKLVEADIDSIMVKHPYDLMEQSRESLKIWQQRNSSNATREVLISTLRKCEFNYIADVMEGKIVD
ncbi:FAS-associated death domain protein-like [Antedon mediterranea]|uniref:FAS-associated death domain protein-like n=1 Tax=Antedon mediterranea TaxID=105859 RepID=UPI003AF8AAB1